MIEIKKIDKSDFDLENCVLRIGDYASYNSYYAITLSHENELLNIGLQAPDTGILPKVTIFNSHIIIGADGKIFIWKPNMNEPIQYRLTAPFYDFYIVDDMIIILYEIGVIALNKQFDTKWEKSFSEIIDLEKIENDILILKDFNGNTIKLSISTGDYIK